MAASITQLQEIADEMLRMGKAHADSIEVHVKDEKGFRVSARNADLDTLEHHQEQGLSITVSLDQHTGSASTSDFSKDALKTTLDKALTIARFTDKDIYSGLPDKSLLAFNYPELQLYHPWSISTEEAISLAVECETSSRQLDSRLKVSDGANVGSYEVFYVYANSHGFNAGYPSTLHSIGCEALAEENGQMQRDYDYTSTRNPVVLQSINAVAEKVSKKVLSRLGARKIETQECPVVFHSDVAKSLLGHFIAAISGNNLYRKTSFLLDRIDKKIFPDFFHVYQNPHLLQGMGSAPFDGEGVITEKRDYVREGILTSYVLGSYSARRLGLRTTGNAGGVYNLFVEPSEQTFDQLLKEMGTGLLVTELMGQGVNLVTGDYSRGAFGYWVENGEVQYPVEEITIAGNLNQMFAGIIAVGNDVDMRGNVKTGSWFLDRMKVSGH